MWIYRFKGVRKTTMVLAAVNLMLVVSGGVLVMFSSPKCNTRQVIPVVAVAFLAVIKIVAMVKMGIAQKLTAMSIVDSQPTNSVMDTVLRFERRVKYKTWLWWTRFSMVITVLQFIGASYLIFHVAKYVSHDPIRKDCVLGLTSDVGWWKKRLQVIFVVIVCFVAIAQCFTGSDVLQWRSFYATEDDAWKAHYLEVFDYGIREVLCCLGRVEYLSVEEEDEVYSVARLLGDLVAYRASGTGHLELLAGLALLQSNMQCSDSYEGSAEAPEEYFQEAATFHKFAEAAYTGPLLDLGRNPAIFLCTWVCRQGILTPWSRYSSLQASKA